MKSNFTFNENFELVKGQEKLTQVMTSALAFQLLKSPISAADCRIRMVKI